MSAAFALAQPHRIKASHRRRWKGAAGRFVQRYYDPQVGRFLSVDPMGVDTTTAWNFNRFNYANNNPYKFTDPDGRFATLAGVAAGGLVAGELEAVKQMQSSRIGQLPSLSAIRSIAVATYRGAAIGGATVAAGGASTTATRAAGYSELGTKVIATVVEAYTALKSTLLTGPASDIASGQQAPSLSAHEAEAAGAFYGSLAGSDVTSLMSSTTARAGTEAATTVLAKSVTAEAVGTATSNKAVELKKQKP